MLRERKRCLRSIRQNVEESKKKNAGKSDNGSCLIAIEGLSDVGDGQSKVTILIFTYSRENVFRYLCNSTCCVSQSISFLSLYGTEAATKECL